MTRPELIIQRKRIFQEMTSLLVYSRDQAEPICNALESMAALRHIYEATCRELDYADLEEGIGEYVDEFKERLCFIEEHAEEPLTVRRETVALCERLSFIRAVGGAS